MDYRGINVGLLNDYSAGAAVKPDTTFGIGAGGWDAIGTVGTAAIDIWSNIALGNINAEMQRDVINFNNKMRAIAEAQRQYANDVNRNAVNDTHMQYDVNISLDRMRAESQVAVEGAYLGASKSAQGAAMYDINRNAVQAKFISQNNFENTLEQIRMMEQGERFNAIQSFQNPDNVQSPSIGSAMFAGMYGLVNKSVQSGAWDNGSKLSNAFAGLFSKGSAVQLPQ